MLLTLLFAVAFANKFWVITDTHFDDKYKANTPSECRAIDCCHEDSKPRKGKEDFMSGACGDYNCYAPLSVSQSAFDYIYAHREESTTIFWMMDTVPADVGRQTKEINWNRIQTQTEELKQRLPGFRVFPIPGNHDHYFMNNWAYPPNDQEMLDFMSGLFADWLSPSALEKFNEVGFYTELLEQGLRVVGLNLVYVDIFNVHCNEYAENDPGNMLQWFNETLQQAKEDNERVIIVSHECIGLASTGSTDLFPQFSKDFNEVMQSYGDVVITHLCGHSHTNSFRVLPSIQNPSYHNIMNPALTTAFQINPRFRLYEYDRDSVKDYTTYMLDIDECNEHSIYNWKEEYVASKAFDLKDDDDLWDTFMEYYSVKGGYECTDTCRRDLICSLHSLTEQAYLACIR
ncbi:Acid sphingomyelinase family phosphodiesterase [Entamoeba marina]